MSTNSYLEVSTHVPDVPGAQKSSDTLVPNRIFVGGISAHTTEGELQTLFSKYGSVKAAKIISDKSGLSKGYGFVTFETDDEAKRLQKEGSIMLGGKRLNIAPAIIKRRSQGPDIQDNQQYAYAYHTGVPPAYNGLLYAPSYGVYVQPQPAYSMIVPQPQYVYQSQNIPPHLMYGAVPAAASEQYSQATYRQTGQQELSTDSSDQEEMPKNVNGRYAPLVHKIPNGSPFMYCDHTMKPTQFAKLSLTPYPHQYTLQMQDRHQEYDIADGMMQSSLLTPPSTPVSKIYKAN